MLILQVVSAGPLHGYGIASASSRFRATSSRCTRHPRPRDIVHDVRFAVRLAWKERGFALTSIGALALGIGVTTMMITERAVLDAVRDRCARTGLLVGLCVVSTILFGLAPALFASKTDLNGVMKEQGRTALVPRVRRWTGTLLAAELALTLVLLAAAGLMARSYFALDRADRALHTSRVLTLEVALPEETAPIRHRRRGSPSWECPRRFARGTRQRRCQSCTCRSRRTPAGRLP